MDATNQFETTYHRLTGRHGIFTSPDLERRTKASQTMSAAAPAKEAEPKSSGSLGGLGKKKGELEVNKLFRALIKFGGSDLHLKVGKPATVRVRGTLRELEMPPINEEEMKRLILPMMDERQLEVFYSEGGADFAHVVEYENDKGVK